MRTLFVLVAMVVAVLFSGCASPEASIPPEEQSVSGTIKSEGPFGTPVLPDRTSAEALVAAAKDHTHAGERRFDEIAHGEKVFYLIEDTDYHQIEGYPGNYMHVRLLEGTYKGRDGWLVPETHFR